MIYSFIISQNNNIPRIKGIISRICGGLGEKRSFLGEDYFTFPTSLALASKPENYYKSLGAGYRDKFIYTTANRIVAEGIDRLYSLDGAALKKELLTYLGIGDKVADCICLFGFAKADSFPVDTWIEKIYREDFGGTLTDRKKINSYFTSMFGEYSGYIQQYLFYAKRTNL
jgi:N-glycosylase/DNA lyase